MNIGPKALIFSLLTYCGCLCAAEPGGVTVGGTRLIYDGSRKEASISVSNSDVNPYLIQSWAENPDGGTARAPFVVTPPLFRLDGNQQNVLRIVRAGGAVPEDRESLFWLNIKSIPAGSRHDEANTLQIAVKTRIKLIYRPAALKGVPENVAEKLTWALSRKTLTVSNPTPFVMNFKQVRIGGHKVPDATYVLPMSRTRFTVPSGLSGPVTWSLISDYGGTGAEHSSGH